MEKRSFRPRGSGGPTPLPAAGVWPFSLSVSRNLAPAFAGEINMVSLVLVGFFKPSCFPD